MRFKEGTKVKLREGGPSYYKAPDKIGTIIYTFRHKETHKYQIDFNKYIVVCEETDFYIPKYTTTSLYKLLNEE